MIVLSWLKSRIIEPTSWIAIGLGAVIVSIAIPDIAIYLLIAAAVTVALGVIMKERGDG
jgi:energy-converting hydrogenase Eha subunit A